MVNKKSRLNNTFIVFIKNIVVFGIILHLFSFSSFAYEIRVLKSKDAKPFDLFMKGFMDTVPSAKISVENMEGDIEKGVKIVRRIQGENPDLILALGAKAAWVAREVRNTRVVFSMLSGPEKYKLGNMAGVKLDVPVEFYLKQAKEIIPGLQIIGVIHSEDRLIAEAKSAAGAMGLEIVSEKISSLEEIQSVMDVLLANVDAIWVHSDPVVMSSSRVVKELIILKALRKRVPVIGFNKWLVDSGGALFCLFSNYDDIGRQTGRLVNRIKESNASHMIESPEALKVFVNKDVVERLRQRIRIEIPQNAYFSD